MAKVCHTCPLWVQLRGNNPNTGKEVDHWGCSLSHLPMLLIENAQQMRQAGAATENMRNEIVKRMDAPRPIDPAPHLTTTPGTFTHLIDLTPRGNT
jgi:hypothetical protein